MLRFDVSHGDRWKFMRKGYFSGGARRGWMSTKRRVKKLETALIHEKILNQKAECGRKYELFKQNSD